MRRALLPILVAVILIVTAVPARAAAYLYFAGASSNGQWRRYPVLVGEYTSMNGGQVVCTTTPLGCDYTAIRIQNTKIGGTVVGDSTGFLVVAITHPTYSSYSRCQLVTFPGSMTCHYYT